MKTLFRKIRQLFRRSRKVRAFTPSGDPFRNVSRNFGYSTPAQRARIQSALVRK